MRIALIAPFGLRPKGTTAARVLPIARVLAQADASVRVIVPPWDDPDQAGRRRHESGYELVHTRLGRGPANPAVILASMAQQIREWRPDVVHAFKPIGYSGVAAWLMSRRRVADGRIRRPLAIVDADDLEGLSGWAGRRRQGISGVVRGIQERVTIRRAHRVTVASRWLAGYAQKLGVDERSIFYLPNGHDPNGHDPNSHDVEAAPITKTADRAQQARRLLWYTRFTEARPERVAELVAPLLHAHTGLRLEILGEEIGSGDRREAMRAFAASGIDDRVDWLGYEASALEGIRNSASGTIAIYPLDDDLVNRARCPSKVPQLMALGVPLIAESVGEVSAYLSGASSLCLAPSGDYEQFRSLVGNLVVSASARDKLSDQLRRASKNWTWDVTAGRLIDWYRAALESDSGADPSSGAG